MREISRGFLALSLLCLFWVALKSREEGLIEVAAVLVMALGLILLAFAPRR